jgi:iron-sulfur cluster assembly protein
MSGNVIGLTPAAAGRVKELLADRGTPQAFIRVGVKTAGCSGLAYKLEYADAPGMGDEVVEAHGVKVIVDAKSVLYLLGTEMDYKVEQMKSGFVFNNPNKKGECGCGESFTV